MPQQPIIVPSARPSTDRLGLKSEYVRSPTPSAVPPPGVPVPCAVFCFDGEPATWVPQGWVGSCFAGD